MDKEKVPEWVCRLFLLINKTQMGLPESTLNIYVMSLLVIRRGSIAWDAARYALLTIMTCYVLHPVM